MDLISFGAGIALGAAFSPFWLIQLVLITGFNARVNATMLTGVSSRVDGENYASRAP